MYNCEKCGKGYAEGSAHSCATLTCAHCSQEYKDGNEHRCAAADSNSKIATSVRWLIIILLVLGIPTLLLFYCEVMNKQHCYVTEISSVIKEAWQKVTTPQKPSKRPAVAAAPDAAGTPVAASKASAGVPPASSEASTAAAQSVIATTTMPTGDVILLGCRVPSVDPEVEVKCEWIKDDASMALRWDGDVLKGIMTVTLLNDRHYKSEEQILTATQQKKQWIFKAVPSR